MRSWSIVTQSDTPVSWPTSPGNSSNVTVFMSAPSYDAGFALAPIAVADEAFIELASRMARQFRFEIDGARAFDRRQTLAAIGDEFLRQRGAGLAPIGRLHHRFHL